MEVVSSVASSKLLLGRSEYLVVLRTQGTLPSDIKAERWFSRFCTETDGKASVESTQYESKYPWLNQSFGCIRKYCGIGLENDEPYWKQQSSQVERRMAANNSAVSRSLMQKGEDRATLPSYYQLYRFPESQNPRVTRDRQKPNTNMV